MKPSFIDRNKEIRLKEIICCLTSIMYCLTSNLSYYSKRRTEAFLPPPYQCPDVETFAVAVVAVSFVVAFLVVVAVASSVVAFAVAVATVFVLLSMLLPPFLLLFIFMLFSSSGHF